MGGHVRSATVALILTALVAPTAAPLSELGAPMTVSDWLVLASEGRLPTDCGYDARIGDAPEIVHALAEPRSHLIPGPEQCTGAIRPGAPASGICTLNFVFTDGANLYIGSAGHCFNVGQSVSTDGVGAFGTVVYSINGGQGNDFSLIRINADKVGLVNPRMCQFGGPIGQNAGMTGIGDTAYEYGWGIATLWTSATRGRIHNEFSQSNNFVSWNGVGSGGDSGAPVLDRDGKALAIHTHGITPIAGVVLEGGTHVARAILLANAAGFNIQLVSGDHFTPVPPDL